jgi:peptidoglycan/LPS O-acetylase OafA/YrhL
VIVVCLIAASTVARDDLARTRGDALWSLIYMNNWHLIVASHSYFDAFGRPSLLQHLWSLAVEEQFYLLWPLLLIAGLRFLGRRWTVVATAVLALGSAALMWGRYNPGHDPSSLYYGTHTRAATLLVGALLAFAWSPVRGPRKVKRPVSIPLEGIGVAALLGVLALFWRVHDYDPWLYRGGFLLAALCAAALVAAVAHPAARLGGLLGSPPLRWLGARSYGIYLWHWPVMQLTRPNVDVSWRGPPLIVAQAVATVTLAALSYRFVEQPIRTGSVQRNMRAWLDRRPPLHRLTWVAGTLVVAVLILSLTLSTPAPNSVVQASSRLATPAALAPIPSTPISLGGEAPAATHDGIYTGAHRIPAVASSASESILAVGDSVMLGCAPNLQQRLGRRLRVDAVVGRQIGDTISRLAEYRARRRLPSTVVVQIGDNGPIWHVDLEHLRRVLGVQRVVLVNVRVARSWQNEVNHALSQFVASWHQAIIANWYGHSSENMLTDGVHPTVAARSVYARVIVEAIHQLQASGR